MCQKKTIIARANGKRHTVVNQTSLLSNKIYSPHNFVAVNFTPG